MKSRIPPPVWLAIAGALMWAVAQSAYALPLSIPYSRVIALITAALGVTIAILAIREFRSADTTVNPLKPEEASALVRTGIFGRSRNPMYLGLLSVLMGWAIWLGSLTNILVLILFFVIITELQIKPEEAALRKLFGQDFTSYCQQVRRWF